jgi:hypothetical protein
MKSILFKILPATCAAALLLPSMVQASSSAPAISPKALATLQRMSDTLAAAKAFTYRSRTAFEVPAKTGQFLTLFSTSHVALKRPDKLSAVLTGEAPHFNFFYDGTNVAAYAPATRVYSITKAPPTIDALLPALQRETGIRFATTPLLLSDPYRALAKGLTSALDVGPASVNGTVCEHLAFMGDGVNWEIWIESGNRPLPRRLAVTFTDRTNFPRTLVEFYDWNLHPGFRPDDFILHKPADAREIPFAGVLKSAGR